MKRTKRLLSTLLALCMVLAMLPATAMASGTTVESVKNRYTVLVLDQSGSMDGEPSKNLKVAAKKFCEAVLGDNGAIQNHLAIVGFSTGAATLHGFNENTNLIPKKIDDLTADGLTNIGAALREAKGLLDAVEANDPDSIKNIVLLSDGLPETDEKTANGPYNSTHYPDYYFYGSANYAYNTAKELGLLRENRTCDYNVYTLGFFHSMSAERASFCKRVLTDLQSAEDGSKFYQITDVGQVDFVLGDYVVNDILSDGEIVTPPTQAPNPDSLDARVVVKIACPVDVAVTCGNQVILNSATNSKVLTSAYGTMTEAVEDGIKGTVKTVTLAPNYRYNLKLTATDTGDVNITSYYYERNNPNPQTKVYSELHVTPNTYIPVSISKNNTVSVPTTPVEILPDGTDIDDTHSHFTYVPTTVGGTVVLSKRNAEPGDWVNVYVTPDEGYKLESLTVTDMRGWPVTLREMGENAFSFTMPNARINVNPVFVKVEADDDPYSTNVPTTIPNIEGTSPNYGNMVINTAAMNYSDVNAGDWFYNNVKFCHERYLLNKTGEADGKFEPNTASTRATVWTALSRLAGRNTVTQGDNWYDRAQIWAKGKGITDGERPMDSMTREEFVTMLWRYDGNKYVQNSALGQFNDGESVSWWATEAVKWAVATGLLNGSNGSLNPQSNVTRAEVAAVLQRYVQNVH